MGGNARHQAPGWELGCPELPRGGSCPPQRALTSSTSFTPSGGTFFFLPLLRGEAELSPRQAAKPGARSQCPRTPTWPRWASPCAPHRSSSTPPNPQPCSFASPAAGSALAGEVSIASCTPLSRAGHRWHHPWHHPSCPSRLQLSALQAAPARLLGAGQWRGESSEAQGCRIRPGRVVLELQLGVQDEQSSRSQRSQLRTGTRGVSTFSHQTPPKGPQPHSQHEEAKQRGGAQHVPSAGSAQGAQVDQDTEQGQDSTGRQERGPYQPLAAGCSHGGPASNTAAGSGSGEKKHKSGCSRAPLGSPWHKMVFCGPPGLAMASAAQSPRGRGSLRVLWRGTCTESPIFWPAPALPGAATLPPTPCPAWCGRPAADALPPPGNNFRLWFLLKNPKPNKPNRIQAPKLPPRC